MISQTPAPPSAWFCEMQPYGLCGRLPLAMRTVPESFFRAAQPGILRIEQPDRGGGRLPRNRQGRSRLGLRSLRSGAIPACLTGGWRGIDNRRRGTWGSPLHHQSSLRFSPPASENCARAAHKCEQKAIRSQRPTIPRWTGRRYARSWPLSHLLIGDHLQRLIATACGIPQPWGQVLVRCPETSTPLLPACRSSLGVQPAFRSFLSVLRRIPAITWGETWNS